MQATYFVLAAVHIVTLIVTGVMWTIVDIVPGSKLRTNMRDIRAVHFGSLHLTAWFFGLAFAFHYLEVPAIHQAAFPCGLGALVFFSGLGYLFPKPPGVDPFYYWTRGWAMWLSLFGLLCLIAALLWTAGVLVVYSIPKM